MEIYLQKFPERYRYCYYRNLETLELFRIDSFLNSYKYGMYCLIENELFFSNKKAIGHELMHMASSDRIMRQFAFESNLNIEGGLVEGMTEYHHMMAYDLKKPGAYSFEVFTTMMLDDIPNVFESFFIPRERGIYDICPNKELVYHLLCALSLYTELTIGCVSPHGEKKSFADLLEIGRDIRQTFDSLIDIKLSLCNNPVELKNYADKFMDLVKSDFMKNIGEYYFPNYQKYAEAIIDRKIRKRG